MGLSHVSGVIDAQGGTFTPDPDCCSTIVPTFGAIQTNTPSIVTQTPQPSRDRTGCPVDDVDPEGLDDDWAAVCSRCLMDLEPTPQVTIPSFIMGTVPPLGTPEAGGTPTVPFVSLYGTPTLGGLSMPPTNTPPPAPTATPSLIEVYWDFREDTHGVSIEGWSLGGAGSGWLNAEWSEGVGFYSVTTFDYFEDYDGQFLQLRLPNHPVLLGNDIETFAIYGSLLSASGAVGFGEGTTARTPSASGSGGSRGSFYIAYGSYEDWALAMIYGTEGGTASGTVTGIAFTYYGYEWSSETPTPSPTATPAPVVISCDTPLYKDISTPIVDIDVSLEDLGSDCYRIVPEIDSSSWSVVGVDLDIGLRVDGVDLCVEWLPFPILAFFGITIASDLLLIIPIAYMAKNLLWF